MSSYDDIINPFIKQLTDNKDYFNKYKKDDVNLDEVILLIEKGKKTISEEVLNINNYIESLDIIFPEQKYDNININLKEYKRNIIIFKVLYNVLINIKKEFKTLNISEDFKYINENGINKNFEPFINIQTKLNDNLLKNLDKLSLEKLLNFYLNNIIILKYHEDILNLSIKLNENFDQYSGAENKDKDKDILSFIEYFRKNFLIKDKISLSFNTIIKNTKYIYNKYEKEKEIQQKKEEKKIKIQQNKEEDEKEKEKEIEIQQNKEEDEEKKREDFEKKRTLQKELLIIKEKRRNALNNTVEIEKLEKIIFSKIKKILDDGEIDYNDVYNLFFNKDTGLIKNIEDVSNLENIRFIINSLYDSDPLSLQILFGKIYPEYLSYYNNNE